MRACEFTTAEDSIAFIKFMLDKTFIAIKARAQKKAKIEASLENTKRIKAKNDKLLSKHRTTQDQEPLSASKAGRPKQVDIQDMLKL